MTVDPPVAKYKYTLVIRGNSHAEIQEELLSQTRGGYLLDSAYETRDAFDTYGGKDHTTLELTNPEMTPERYERELREWSEERKAARRIRAHGPEEES